MREEVVVRCVCDRCEVTFFCKADDGRDVGSPDIAVRIDGPLIEKLLKLKKGEGLLFEDLCEKCTARVTSLLEAMMKSGKGKSTSRKNTGKTTVKKNTSKPNQSNSNSETTQASPV